MGTLQVLTGVVFLAAGYTLCKDIFLLLCNIRLARRSGIQYVLVPVNSYNRWFALLGARLLGLADCFFGAPTSPTSWRWLVRGGWPWRIRYAPFEKMGTDTFLTVAPGGCIMYTADADVIRQILGRMSDFPKPTFLYRNVDIFGKNVVTTDGAAWRRHRRLVAPALGERNNRLVWEETVRQMQSLMQRWSKTESQAVRTVHKDAMGFSLNVIGKAGFGQEMGLPGHEDQGKGIPGGHTMAFAASLECLLSNILPIVVLPKWFLRRGPSRLLRAAYKSYCEFRQYMCEMLRDKKSAIHSSPEASARSNMDLLGQIVKGQDLHLLEEADKNPEYTGGLTDSEVLGNLFVLLFAGHETTAGTLHSLIIMLAIHPWDQRRLQAALDSILEDSVAKTNWSSDLSSAASCFNYDALLPKLLSSPYVTAVVNETLRLMGPIPTIPKYVPATAEPQRLIVDGVEVSVPPGTRIKLCAACVHRNPKYWPHQTQSYRQSAAPFRDKTRVPGTHWTSWPPANQHNDLEGFRPERWLETIYSSKPNNESWTSVISPPFGAFIPFSEGPRACLGKRFAQVELVAALAVLFSSHSVELAVDELAGVNFDALRAMDRDERRQMWECAAEEANGRWRKTMSMVITLQMRGAHVPVRLVRRGSEMFDDL